MVHIFHCVLATLLRYLIYCALFKATRSSFVTCWLPLPKHQALVISNANWPIRVKCQMDFTTTSDEYHCRVHRQRPGCSQCCLEGVMISMVIVCLCQTYAGWSDHRYLPKSSCLAHQHMLVCHKGLQLSFWSLSSSSNINFLGGNGVWTTSELEQAL